MDYDLKRATYTLFSKHIDMIEDRVVDLIKVYGRRNTSAALRSLLDDLAKYQQAEPAAAAALAGGESSP